MRQIAHEGRADADLVLPCIDSVFRIDADSVTFVGAAARVDVADFEQLLSGGTDDLSRAEALYRGDLLAVFCSMQIAGDRP